MSDSIKSRVWAGVIGQALGAVVSLVIAISVSSYYDKRGSEQVVASNNAQTEEFKNAIKGQTESLLAGTESIVDAIREVNTPNETINGWFLAPSNITDDGLLSVISEYEKSDAGPYERTLVNSSDVSRVFNVERVRAFWVDRGFNESETLSAILIKSGQVMQKVSLNTSI